MNTPLVSVTLPAMPGMDCVYIHEKALFDRLLASQERMTAAILELLNGKRG